MGSTTLKTELLDQAAPFVRPKLLAFHAKAGFAGYRLLVVRCWASVDAQMAIYQIGRTLDRESGEWVVSETDKIRTRAKPGRSGHNIITLERKPASMCADFIPLDKQGVPLWPKNRQEELEPARLDQRWLATFGVSQAIAWGRLYELAHKCGLDPLGDPVGAYLPFDKGHFEEPGYTVTGFLEAVGCQYPDLRPVAV